MLGYIEKRSLAKAGSRGKLKRLESINAMEETNLGGRAVEWIVGSGQLSKFIPFRESERPTLDNLVLLSHRRGAITRASLAQLQSLPGARASANCSLGYGMEPYASPMQPIDRRSSPSSSEGSGALDRQSQGAHSDGRRRHIVRSGGRSGVQIITAYNPSAGGAIQSYASGHGAKRPREETIVASLYPEVCLCKFQYPSATLWRNEIFISCNLGMSVIRLWRIETLSRHFYRLRDASGLQGIAR